MHRLSTAAPAHAHAGDPAVGCQLRPGHGGRFLEPRTGANRLANEPLVQNLARDAEAVQIAAVHAATTSFVAFSRRFGISRLLSQRVKIDAVAHDAVQLQVASM